MTGTSRNHNTTGKSSNKRPSSTRPHDFRETERESTRLGGKWAGMGHSATSCCWRVRLRRKAQPRLRAGRDGGLARLRANCRLCSAETFDSVYSVEGTGLESNFLRFRRSFFKSPQTRLPPGFPGHRPILCLPRVRSRTFGEYLGRSNFLRGMDCVTARNHSIHILELANRRKGPARIEGPRMPVARARGRPLSQSPGPKSAGRSAGVVGSREAPERQARRPTRLRRLAP